MILPLLNLNSTICLASLVFQLSHQKCFAYLDKCGFELYILQICYVNKVYGNDDDSFEKSFHMEVVGKG